MRTAFVLGTILVAAGCGGSPSPPTPSQEAAKDATASRRGMEITDRLLAVYRGAKSYADHATYVEQSAVRGEGVERELPFFQMSLAYQRPNRLRLTFEEAIAGASGRRAYDIACDGHVLRTSAAEVPHQIQESPAPEALTAANFVADPLVQRALFQRPLGDVFPQLAMLLNIDEAADVFPQDQHPLLLGKETLRGRECFRVASTNPDGTRVLWVDCEKYTLLRMELPTAAHRRAVDPDNNFLNLRVWIDFEDVTLDAAIAPASFSMEVPASARRVKKFVPPPSAAPEKTGNASKDDASTSADAQAEKQKSEAEFQRELEAATISQP